MDNTSICSNTTCFDCIRLTTKFEFTKEFSYKNLSSFFITRFDLHSKKNVVCKEFKDANAKDKFDDMLLNLLDLCEENLDTDISKSDQVVLGDSLAHAYMMIIPRMPILYRASLHSVASYVITASRVSMPAHGLGFAMGILHPATPLPRCWRRKV